MTAPGLAPCPVTVSINVDVESVDAGTAGDAGLFGRYSYGRYGAREGLWRLLNVLRDVGVAATFFIDIEDAMRHPALVEAIAGDGHELAAQGTTVDAQSPLAPGDPDLPARAADLWLSLTGAPLKGWRSANGLIGVDTLRQLSRLGLHYDSSFEDDDRPYAFQDADGHGLVELPVFGYLADAPFYAAKHGPERVAKAWREEADALYDAGGYVHLRLHSRGDCGSARAVRARVVADFLTRLARRPGVGFYRCDALAALAMDDAAAKEPFPTWPPA